jgi:nucleotide-binding universal stress UspA family protein
MVNREADRPYRSAVGAVDMSPPSVNALRTGAALGFPGGDHLTLVHAYLAPARGRMAYAAISSETIERYIDEEGEHTTKALIDFLHDNDVDEHGVSIRIEEGAAMPVIAGAVEQLNPDVLIIGTQGRSLIAKAIMGSVAEEALRSVSVDILAVPPGKSRPKAVARRSPASERRRAHPPLA